MRAFRQRFTEQICARDNHIADVMVLANLLRGALFFASTSIFILGGLVALVGTAPKVNEVISQIPFTGPSEIWLSEVKALILIVVYVYAFFKFTWSAWQYNVLAIIVGAAPSPGGNEADRARYAEFAARVASLAGDSYNHGIRAYYFSIAIMAWFVHPVLFLAATLIITVVIYRREFSSSMLAVLRSLDAETVPRR